MNLIFLGAPGAGKGTQAEIVCGKLKIPAISTGNMLREAIKNGTPEGLVAKEYMDKGNFAPDEIVIGVLKDRISKNDAKNGFILDGFPRTVAQAEELKKLGVEIDKVIEIDVPDDVICGRISGRRVCENCGASYHIEYKPTSENGVCDSCGGKVVQRVDDKPETVLLRLKTYHEKTAPLKGYYEKQGKLISVKGQTGIDDTASLILRAIEG